MHKDITRQIFSPEHIRSKVKDLGRFIEEDYKDKSQEGIVLVALLRGAALFASDLAREIALPLELDYMTVSSYGDESVSSGLLEVKSDVSTDIAGKHVIIVEDIIDSGLTLSLLVPALKEKGAKSVEVAVLLKKNDPKHDVDAKYIGFTCPDGFIVGYGLDYAGRYRNLPYIGILREEVIARKSEEGVEENKGEVIGCDPRESEDPPNL